MKFPDSFWLTSLSEGNFANRYWLKYYKNFIKDSNLKKDLIENENFFLNLISYLRNFLKDFLLSIFLKKINKKIDKKKNIVYLNSSHIKKNRYGKIYNVYTDNVIEGDKKNLYLLTISRESRKNLISSYKIIKNFYRYKNYENIIFLESYFSPKQVLRCYILDVIKNFYISSKIINRLDFKDISPIIIINDLAKQNTVFSLKNNLNFNKTFKRIKLLFCPVFELVEGRVVINLFNSIKIKTVGIVHGLPGKLHNLRLIKSIIKIPKISKPQIIFSTGKKINTEFINNGFKNSFEIGYPRENKSLPNLNLSLIKKKKY